MVVIIVLERKKMHRILILPPERERDWLTQEKH